MDSSMKIVMGITTIPERLRKGFLERALRSIVKLDGLQYVSAIVINIPRVSRKGELYDMEKANRLVSYCPEKIVIHQDICDEGPITKFLGTMKYIDKTFGAESDNVWMCILDDDIMYAPDMLTNLMAKWKPTDLAIGTCGRTGYQPTYQKHLTWRMEALFMETFAGVLYKRQVFGDLETFKAWLATLPPDAFFVDDIVVGAWMSKHTYPMYLVSYSGRETHDSGDTAALYLLNEGKRNIRAQLQFQKLGYFSDINVGTRHVQLVSADKKSMLVQDDDTSVLKRVDYDPNSTYSWVQRPVHNHPGFFSLRSERGGFLCSDETTKMFRIEEKVQQWEWFRVNAQGALTTYHGSVVLSDLTHRFAQSSPPEIWITLQEVK